MKNFSLRCIKQNGIRSLFEIIAENDAVSRAELSDTTGISLMTVGKVADTLLFHEAVLQTKAPQNHPGRRTGYLKINESKIIVVIDLADRSITLFDLRLTVKEKLPFPDCEPLSAPFFSFLSEKVLTAHEFDDISGLGIIIPSSAIAEQSASAIQRKTADLIGNYFGDIPFLTEYNVSAAARAYASEIDFSEGKNILCLLSEGGETKGVHVVQNEPLPGIHIPFREVGRICDSQGLSFDERLRCANSAESFFEIFAHETANILRLFAPHALVVSRIEEIPSLSAKLEIFLKEHGFDQFSLPEIREAVQLDDHAKLGLAMNVRTSWLDNLTSERKI